MSKGSISSSNLYDEIDSSIVELFIYLASQEKSLFVFDNVDHYIDLEYGSLTGILQDLFTQASRNLSQSRVIITCRPLIKHISTSSLILPLPGITLRDTIELFQQRDATSSTHAEIEDAYELTKGHAFWLDLMAVQVARIPSVTLKGLLEDHRRGRSDTPDILTPICVSHPVPWTQVCLMRRA